MSELPFQWRSWVAECVAQGILPAALRVILLENNFSPEAVDNELQEAQSHPYMAALLAMNNTVKRREWLLGVYDDKFRANKKYGKKIEVKTKMPPFKKFLKDYIYENRPVIFKDAIKDWKAMSWTFDSIKQKVGNPEIEVQANRSHDPIYERTGSKYKTLMNFHDFIDKLVTLGRSNDLYLTGNNYSKSFAALKPLYDELGELGDGWLDMHRLNGEMFLWIGPAGTITHAHHDLRDNLFVQIHGRKKFIIAPACQVPYLYNRTHVFSEVDFMKPDHERFPEFARADIIEVIVNPGDCLYVPVGWWHAVESLDNSISFSSCNINFANDFYKKFPLGDNHSMGA